MNKTEQKSGIQLQWSVPVLCSHTTLIIIVVVVVVIIITIIIIINHHHHHHSETCAKVSTALPSPCSSTLDFHSASVRCHKRHNKKCMMS